MNKLANARSHETFRKQTHEGVVHRGIHLIPVFFRRSLFLERAKGFIFKGKPSYLAATSAGLQDFIVARRNIPHSHFVYTGAAPYGLLKARFRKNPAVAAAGS